MDFDTALNLKLEFMDRFILESGHAGRARSNASRVAEAMGTAGPADRLAIGVSGKPNVRKGFQLELRVQRADGPAFLEATKIIDQVKGEARLRILPRIEFPSIASLLECMGSAFGYPPNDAPLQLGDPIRTQRAGAGSLGGFLKTPKGAALLGSSHVLAPYSSSDRPKQGDTVYRPTSPRGSIRASSEVASLLDWSVLDKAKGNYVDAAIARLCDDPEPSYEGNVIPDRSDVPSDLRGQRLKALKPASAEQIAEQFRSGNFALLGAKVAKLGATTGYSEGIISAGLIDGITAYVPWLGNVVFLNVFEIEPADDSTRVTEPGDSGAGFFDRDEKMTFGLHFASCEALDENSKRLGFRVSYACSIQTILHEFEDCSWM